MMKKCLWAAWMTAAVLLTGNVWAQTGRSVRAATKEGNEGIPQDGLVAYYPFTGSLEDASGNGFHLDNAGGTLSEDRFLAPFHALSFDGLAHNAQASFQLTNAFSVGFWFKTTVSKESRGSAASSRYNGHYILYPVHGGSNAGIGIRVGTNGIEVVEHGTDHLPVQWQYKATIGTEWNHVCLVLQDKSSASIYLNGECVGTASLTGREKYFCPIVGGSGYGYYTGQVDELCIYNRALTAEEITQIHEAGATSDTDSDGDGLSDTWERGVGRYEIVQAPTTNGWTWHEAKADAEARGGHLATITSEAEWGGDFQYVWDECVGLLAGRNGRGGGRSLEVGDG